MGKRLTNKQLQQVEDMILLHVMYHPGKVIPGHEIAAETMTSVSTVSRVAMVLVSRGLLKRLSKKTYEPATPPPAEPVKPIQSSLLTDSHPHIELPAAKENTSSADEWFVEQLRKQYMDYAMSQWAVENGPDSLRGFLKFVNGK